MQDCELEHRTYSEARDNPIDAICAILRVVARSGVQPKSDAIGGGVDADEALAWGEDLVTASRSG